MALLAALALAPSVGAAELIKEEGHVAATSLKEYAAKCVYDPSTLLLSKIRVFKPTVFSDYPAGNNSWVGWRFKVLHSPNSIGPWNVVHTSSWQKDKATNSAAADGFTRRDWKPPANPEGIYVAQVEIVFYWPGTKNDIEGRVVWDLNPYRYGRNNWVTWCVAQD
jgi:hypothetical protein